MHTRTASHLPDSRLLHEDDPMIPVLAIGGEKSFGAYEAVVMRNAADNVTELVVPGAGHWLMEEAPTQTIAAIRGFLDAP